MSEYEIRRHPRARQLKLTVYPGGRTVVTVPKRVSLQAAARFVASKSDWITRARSKVGVSLPVNDITINSRRHYLRHREAARRLIEKKTALLNEHYKYSYSRISIRNQKTRWGSCSTSGNLNFNYKILFLTESLQDYIIVHELCHLAEMNHGKRFWELVGETIPDYKKCCRDLLAIARGRID